MRGLQKNPITLVPPPNAVIPHTPARPNVEQQLSSMQNSIGTEPEKAGRASFPDDFEVLQVPPGPVRSDEQKAQFKTNLAIHDGFELSRFTLGWTDRFDKIKCFAIEDPSIKSKTFEGQTIGYLKVSGEAWVVEKIYHPAVPFAQSELNFEEMAEILKPIMQMEGIRTLKFTDWSRPEPDTVVYNRGEVVERFPNYQTLIASLLVRNGLALDGCTGSRPHPATPVFWAKASLNDIGVMSKSFSSKAEPPASLIALMRSFFGISGRKEMPSLRIRLDNDQKKVLALYSDEEKYAEILPILQQIAKEVGYSIEVRLDYSGS